MTVYMGSDAPGFWDFIPKAFTAAFPGIQIHMVTDLSKYHNARIDNQLARGDLVADIAILQTTQDFDRWKAAGELLKYRPVGWRQVYRNAKDPDGYWTGVFYAAFSPIVATTLAPADPAAFRATDLLAPAFKDKIIATYPNDDDAVLFWYKLTIEQYGWEWLDKLVAAGAEERHRDLDLARAGRCRTAGLAQAAGRLPQHRPLRLPAFMSDQAAVDRFRSQVELYVGPVKGADPGDPGGTLGRTPSGF